MKKSFIIMLLVVASMTYASQVFATMEVYYESYKTGGVIETGYNTITLLFTFQVPEPRFFDKTTDVWIGANLKQRNAFCTDAWKFGIASTTEPTHLGGFLWYTDTFPISYKEYKFYTSTRPSTSRVPGVWLLPNHDYGVYADITCNGKNLSATADELRLTAYGFISWGGNYIDDFNAGGTPPIPPPEPEVPDPVIIVPGIMGSAYKNGELVIDPILHTYDDLIATLDENGYTPDVDLFTFPYEWRDSNVFTANLLDDKIEEVKQICDCDKVDIVAHSMGGLVSRAYIQSVDYDDDVDQVIFLGTPHHGSVVDYIKWEAGQFVPEFFDTLAGIFFSAESIRNGYTTVFDYIRNRPILSVQELLPTFDYLKEKDTGIIRTYPSNYSRNLFIENLNNNISDLLNSGVEIINIAGNTGRNTIEKIRVIPSTSPVLWGHGEPDGFYIIPGDHGLENGVGDGTVTAFGSTLDNSIPNESSDASHRRLPTEEENKIFNILTGETATTSIDNGFEISPIVLLLQLLSPVDVVVTTPDGKKIGKNFSNSTEYNEIPDAFYSGFQTDNEYITILNPLDGEYKIEVQGTGSGGKYGILTSYISDEFATTTRTTGITEPNQITNLEVLVNNQNPGNLKVERQITVDVLINDIEGAYNLGWIKDKKTKDELIKKVQKMEKKDKKIDKNLAKLLKVTLNAYRKEKISEQAYNLIKIDLEWLINN